ncbi:hypothetical protein K443DRAFT_124507 [Laccaria amethystina LaAM-08-1]|uniref:Uncharacterized protein n=1 Tax=Laccaria amethystina LaAM-08-1 TaxID=1095629 RepID=A0A0C9XJ61_9AGAR|nr:hypothetical protein K443DRAFT_124507 [Laccaria amethystina LaAM-08-1]
MFSSRQVGAAGLPLHLYIPACSIESADLLLERRATGPGTALPRINLMFELQTDVGNASGVARLVPTVDGEWKMHAVYTNLESLRGFPERVGELRHPDPNFGRWEQQRRRASKRTETRWYSLLEPYRPVYAPAVKLANWLERYAETFEWLSSNITSIDRDPATNKWNVSVTRGNGERRRFTVKHRIGQRFSQSAWHGKLRTFIMSSSSYDYAAHDIAQDYYNHGVAGLTRGDIDTGAGQLIAEGNVKLKNDALIKRFMEIGIKFDDGG